MSGTLYLSLLKNLLFNNSTFFKEKKIFFLLPPPYSGSTIHDQLYPPLAKFQWTNTTECCNRLKTMQRYHCFTFPHREIFNFLRTGYGICLFLGENSCFEVEKKYSKNCHWIVILPGQRKTHDLFLYRNLGGKL